MSRWNLVPIAAALTLAAPAAASTWHLYRADCTGGTAAVEIPCGAYGRFLLDQTVAPQGCILQDSGSETPPAYPQQGPMHHVFPGGVDDIDDITIPSASRSRTKTRIATRPGPAPAPAPDPVIVYPGDWIAVIDFNNAHGLSTTWLAGHVAGPTATPRLVSLDDPALATFGPVGDFHVLAKVCKVADLVHDRVYPPPATVNMSFGRATRPNEPTSSTCVGHSAACQIAKVIAHVKAGGTVFVAAAGNHGEGLFPGSLTEVIAAGMLDLTSFVAGGPTRPAWETPSDAEAWIPGNGLCLDAWSAPAGSSYSSAMLAGWLVKPLKHPDVIAALGPGPYTAVRHPTRGCIVLGKGTNVTPWCNTAITAIFEDLQDPSSDACVQAVSSPTAAAPSPGPSVSPDPLPSVDRWGVPTHPAPESDPCVPCTGELSAGTDGGDDLTLDFSQSGAMPQGMYLDSVALRVGESYFSLDLTPAQITDIQRGELATLVVPNAASLFEPYPSLSLWYRIKEAPAIDCATSLGGCYWSSTPLLLAPPR